jgi:hypothetical protein
MSNRVVLILACAATALAPSLAARAQSTERAAAQSPPSWNSPSLVDETVTAPNGAITTRTALRANELWGLTETKVAEKVTEGVYALRGWGIASSYALEAPDGWLIIDTGDSTRAAAEMRELLEGRSAQDQGCGHPAHALALRRRHRCVARRGHRDLGT